MKAHLRSIVILSSVLAFSALAQKKPGNPEDSGLQPKTGTFYINVPPDNVNNGSTESLGVAIANNGNVIVGWEDDGSDITDFEAVWMVFDPAGKALSTDTLIKSVDGTSVTTKYRAYFRKDGTPVSGNTSWGPKIKANLFGDGFGMGATSYALGLEVPEFAAIQTTPTGDAGDFPGVQLLANDGKPIGIVSGVSDTDADPDGDIRIGDWEYLANGNIVIVGESRQKDDLVNRWKGAAPGNHAIYRIVDATGKEVRALGIVSATPDPNEIWHGVGVTKNGFAVRFGQGGRAQVRLFDNSGVPITTTNIDLGTVTGKAAAAGGGRGDGAGFHGNGNDAYVAINSGADEAGAPQIWVTVLNANGTVRYSRAVSDDLTLTKPGRADAAIDPSGRVIAVYNDNSPTAGANSLVLGRVFDAQGKPAGATFFVSDTETDATASLESRNPRVAWRANFAAIIWESKNDPETDMNVVAARLFSTFEPGSIESAGLKRIVSDTPIINPQIDALGNWEPNISVLGSSTFLLEGNTFADGSNAEQRYVVALQPADGKPMKLSEGFFADNGQPFKGAINASRQNGNPGRVAGDKRPGAVNFIVGGEASPHTLAEFQSDNRWNLGFDRGADGRYGVVQTFRLDPATLTQTSLTKAFDAVNGRLTSGTPATTPEIGRFGGEVAGLDNGNFVVVVDDRSNTHATDRAATAVIVAPDGKIVKDTFLIDIGQIWSNVAAYQGGFCVRVNGTLRFYDNDGNLKGQAAQNTSGESYDSGRGDGTRIASHINSPYVFLAGKVSTGNLVKVAVWDARDQKFVTVTEVSEPAFAGDFDRVNLAVDALNRITVSWVSKPPGYEQNQVAARVLAFNAGAKSITALTKSFLPFVNAGKTGIRTLQMSVAMTTKEICIAAKGEINLQNKPEQGVNSPREINFYTVISHPDPKDDPTPPAGVTKKIFTSKVTQASGQNWNGVIWDPGPVAPSAGNIYELLSNGTAFGNAQNNTRIRNPATAGVQTFPGDSLTLNANTEIRAKAAGAILNFPGVGGQPGLILNGGVLNAGDDTVFVITGRVHVASTSYIVPADNGGGAVLQPRGFNIAGVLSGNGSLVIYQAGTNAAQEISGSQNTYTGDIIVKAGKLKGSGNNSLGTGNITIDPKVNVNAPASITAAEGPAWFEVTYDINSPGKLTLQNGGRMILHQNATFGAVTIEGTALSRGTHPYSELAAAYPNNFAAGGSGSLTVGAPSTGGPTFNKPSLSGNTLTISWTGGGKLQEAAEVTGPWTDVAGSPAGSYAVQTTGAHKFYRVVGP